MCSSLDTLSAIEAGGRGWTWRASVVSMDMTWGANALWAPHFQGTGAGAQELPPAWALQVDAFSGGQSGRQMGLSTRRSPNPATWGLSPTSPAEGALAPGIGGGWRFVRGRRSCRERNPDMTDSRTAVARTRCSRSWDVMY